MTWADFYLICFAVGFFFSLLSFLAGGMRWHLHLPHFSHVHVATPPVAAGHGAPAGHSPATAARRGAVNPRPCRPHFALQFHHRDRIPGLVRGAGYLLTRFSGVWFVTGLGLAVVSGLVGGTHCVSFSQPGVDLAGRKHGSRRLRNDRRAGPSLGLDPGEWHGRNHLLAGGHAAHLRRPRNRWSGSGEGN